MTTAAAGLLVGPWQLGEVIGRGGQATVLAARHVTLGRSAAVKLVHATVWADPAFRVRFQRECDALARIEHPHIITVLDAGECDGRGYLVMRLARGGSLAERIAAGPLPVANVMAILTPVAAALDAVHRAGHVHRDVTPANILLDATAGPWLGDFGLARPVDATVATDEGLVVGTAPYLAPEVISGGRAAPAADRYALAAVAYHALTGRPPHHAPELAGVLYGHLHGTPPPVASLRPGLPAALDAAFAEGLARDPARRPASAGALIALLARAAATPEATRILPSPHGPSSPPVASTAATVVGPSISPARRGRRLWRYAATAAAVVALGGSGAVAAIAYTDLGALPFLGDAPAAVVVADSVPDRLGGEVAARPATGDDLPAGLTPVGAVAATVDGLRVVSLPGGRETLGAIDRALAADLFRVRPWELDGRPLGLSAARPWSFFSLSDGYGALVVREPAGERAILVHGPAGDVDAYMESLARAASARVLSAG